MFRPICRFITALALSSVLAVTVVATEGSPNAVAGDSTPSTPDNHWCC